MEATPQRGLVGVPDFAGNRYLNRDTRDTGFQPNAMKLRRSRFADKLFPQLFPRFAHVGE
jgi:hypothetical protein